MSLARSTWTTRGTAPSSTRSSASASPRFTKDSFSRPPNADVVLWDGDPLELSSAPVGVWIDGRAQPMRSRQRALRDRYLVPTEGALPKAYER